MLTQKHRQALDESIIGDMWIDSVAERAGFTREEIEPIVLAIFKKLPAKTIDYDAILSGDPIACDPLVVQGQISVLRFDDIYKIAHRHFFYSTQSQKLTIKTTKTGKQAKYDPNYVDGQFVLHEPRNSGEKLEETTAVNYEGIKYLELAMRAVDRGLRATITVVRRKEKLQRRAEREARGELAPIPKKKKPKSKHRDLDYDRGMEAMQGYPDPDSTTKRSAVNGHSKGRTHARSNGCFTASGERKNLASGGQKSPEVPANPTQNVSVPCPDSGTPVSAHANNVNGHSEEEPVASNLLETSASPREPLLPTTHQPQTTSHFPPSPPFHKRE